MMNRAGKNSICVFSLLWGMLTYSHAQPAWTVITNTYQQTIIVRTDSVFSNSIMLETGDVIGVFYKSNLELICGGKMTWETGNNVMTIYNNRSIDNKTDPGNVLFFRIWKKSEGCIMDSVKGNFRFSSDSLVATTTIDTLNMMYLAGKKLEAGYAMYGFCSNAGTIAPRLVAGTYGIRYSCSQLPIDALTGIINIPADYKGELVVRLTSEYCLASPQQKLLIKPAPEALLPQEMDICEGRSVEIAFREAYSRLSTYSDSVELNSIMTSENSYLVNLSLGTCKNSQQVQVNMRPKPVIDTLYEDMCDSVKIGLVNTEGTVRWTFGTSVSSERQLHFNTDQSVRLEYTDSYGCTASHTFDVRIRPIQINSLDAEVIDADCYTRGQINIGPIVLENNVGDTELILENLITGEHSPSDGLLKEGRYRLLATDSRKCRAQWKDELVVLKDCLNDSPVFSPNEDGRDDDYYIPYEGTVYIYNKNGQLISKFTGPAYWDGRDDDGNKLPLGIYLLVTGTEAITITVLR